MSRALDALYAVAVLLLSPWLLWRAWRTGRYKQTLRERLWGADVDVPPGAVWFHGVSLGEINMLRSLVAAFLQRHPSRAVVVSSTTDTGLEAARKHFPDLTVFPWPFDFSWAVSKVLDRVKPALVVLGESELWPNFLAAARQRGVPVVVVNGRMSPRSVSRYGMIKPLVRWMFATLERAGVQTEEHAAGLLALGATPGRVRVMGNIKYDGALTDRGNGKTLELRRLLGLGEGNSVWVVGSTQPPEERLALETFLKLREARPGLRLMIVPRAPERFDEVARMLEGAGVGFIRRSAILAPLQECPPIVLLDTMGELGALYGLADVAFVGGSLDGKRGGQSMIEPAAFGAAVVFGPHVWNFRHTADSLLALGAAHQVRDGAELTVAVGRLLDDARERRETGAAARAFVLMQQGATQRTLDLLDEVLCPAATKAA